MFQGSRSGGFSLFCLKLRWFPNSKKPRVLQGPARSALSALSHPVSPVRASLFLTHQQSLCTAFCTLSMFSMLVALKNIFPRDIYDLASDKPDHPLKNGLDFQFAYAIINLVNKGTWVCAGLSGKGKPQSRRHLCLFSCRN